MVSHRRPGRARRRREFVFQGAQEKRHRHGGGHERLSRRPRSFIAARTGSEGLRGGGTRTRRKRRALRRSAVERREAGETAASCRGDCRARERIAGGISEDAFVVPVARSGFSAHVHRQTEARRDSRGGRSAMGQWGRRGELAGYDRRNRGTDRADERRRQRSRPERKSRQRSAFEFARSRRVVGRDRGPLPGGPERNAFHFGAGPSANSRAWCAGRRLSDPNLCSRAGRSAGR